MRTAALFSKRSKFLVNFALSPCQEWSNEREGATPAMCRASGRGTWLRRGIQLEKQPTGCGSHEAYCSRPSGRNSDVRPGLRRGHQAGDHLRSRRQVRQILQRSGLQRRREVQDRNRHRVSRFRDPERRPARAGAAQIRRGRQQSDRHGRLLLGGGARKGLGRLPGHQVRHHRHGRRQAERPLGRLQGTGRLLPRRRARRDGLASPRRSASSAAWTSR